MRLGKVLASLVSASFFVPLAHAQGEGAGNLTFPVISIGIVGVIAALYILLSPGRLPRGKVLITKSFQNLLVIGAVLIAIAQIILVMEALGIAKFLPLPIVHDTMMAISIVFIALAFRELTKLRTSPTIGAESEGA